MNLKKHCKDKIGTYVRVEDSKGTSVLWMQKITVICKKGRKLERDVIFLPRPCNLVKVCKTEEIEDVLGRTLEDFVKEYDYLVKNGWVYEIISFACSPWSIDGRITPISEKDCAEILFHLMSRHSKHFR